MARICFLTTGQLSRNPRLIRNASALAAAGHAVTAIYPDHQPSYHGFDAEIAREARFHLVALDYCRTPTGRLRWQLARIRHAIGVRFAGTRSRLLRHAVNYFAPEMERAALAAGSDLFFAQQHPSAVIAERVAQRAGVGFAVDAEDVLSAEPGSAGGFMARVERECFPRAALVTTMSEAAADHFADSCPLSTRPLALHNCPSLSERLLVPPAARLANPDRPPSLYWFGQMLGPHSCADQVLRALGQLDFPTRLVLRGSPVGEFASELRALQRTASPRVELLLEPPAPPAEMVRIASEHDVLVGTQPGDDLFHQLAIGNKVFTGMMAGCALVLTDTIAHRRLLASHPAAGVLFQGEAELVRELKALLTNREQLLARRQRSWDLAENRFSWEQESLLLVRAVARLNLGVALSA